MIIIYLSIYVSPSVLHILSTPDPDPAYDQGYRRHEELSSPNTSFVSYIAYTTELVIYIAY